MLKLQVHYFYYFIVLAIFLIITAPSLFSEGMFMDGLFYAAVSNNMAEGIGTFWKPYLAEYYYAEFFEHPPLALGLQSACFRIFGDSIYVERFYALACYLITGCLISLIWKELTGDTKTGWLPILLWMTVAIIPWACANNMLENTMSIFVCLSVLFYLKFNQNDHFSFLLLSAFSLSLALLTKGLVCLYVWALPFILWLVYRNMTFVKMTASTLLIVLFTLLPLIVLYLFYEPAANSISRYLNDQLFTSLEKIVTVDSRFHIVGEFLQNILIPLALALLFIGIYYFKNKKLDLLKGDHRMSAVFMLLCMAGVLPIMISLKQRGFYILTVYPFFAIALALIILPIIKQFTYMVPDLIVKRLSLAFIATALILSIIQINRVGRDAEIIADCHKVIETIGENQILNIDPSTYPDWGLHGYFARYGQISLDTNTVTQPYLYLAKGSQANAENLKEEKLDLNQFKLYKREN